MFDADNADAIFLPDGTQVMQVTDPDGVAIWTFGPQNDPPMGSISLLRGSLTNGTAEGATLQAVYTDTEADPFGYQWQHSTSASGPFTDICLLYTSPSPRD